LCLRCAETVKKQAAFCKKEGKFEIETVRPKLSGGVRRIVDEKFTDSKRFRESEEGDVEE
jgi:hypothetical protein